MDRFPQLLQSYVGLPGGEGEDWSQVAARLLVAGHLRKSYCASAQSVFLRGVVRGKVHGVYWGRQGAFAAVFAICRAGPLCGVGILSVAGGAALVPSLSLCTGGYGVLYLLGVPTLVGLRF